MISASHDAHVAEPEKGYLLPFDFDRYVVRACCNFYFLVRLGGRSVFLGEGQRLLRGCPSCSRTIIAGIRTIRAGSPTSGDCEHDLVLADPCSRRPLHSRKELEFPILHRTTCGGLGGIQGNERNGDVVGGLTIDGKRAIDRLSRRSGCAATASWQACKNNRNYYNQR